MGGDHREAVAEDDDDRALDAGQRTSAARRGRARRRGRRRGRCTSARATGCGRRRPCGSASPTRAGSIVDGSASSANVGSVMPRSRNRSTLLASASLVDDPVGETELVDERRRSVAARVGHGTSSLAGRPAADAADQSPKRVDFGNQTTLPVMAELTDAKRRLVERLKRVESASAGELATRVRAHRHRRAPAPRGAAGESGLVRRARRRRRQDGAAARARWQLTLESAPSVRRSPRRPDRRADRVDPHSARRGRARRRDRPRAPSARPSSTGAASADGSVARQGPPARRAAHRRGLRRRGARRRRRRCARRAPLPDLRRRRRRARACAAAELEVFRAALGDGVTVEREQHLLSGDQRCAYRITAPATDPPRVSGRTPVPTGLLGAPSPGFRDGAHPEPRRRTRSRGSGG